MWFLLPPSEEGSGRQGRERRARRQKVLPSAAGFSVVAAAVLDGAYLAPVIGGDEGQHTAPRKAAAPHIGNSRREVRPLAAPVTSFSIWDAHEDGKFHQRFQSIYRMHSERSSPPTHLVFLPRAPCAWIAHLSSRFRRNDAGECGNDTRGFTVWKQPT